MFNIEFETLKFARMLSGIAYSIIQDANKIEDLKKAEKMLKRTENILRKVPWQKRDVSYGETRGKMLSNQAAKMQKMADILKKISIKNYKEAYNLHNQTLVYRMEIADKWEDRMGQEKNNDLQRDIAISYKNVATELFHLGEYEEAIKKHEKGIKICHNIGDKSKKAILEKLMIGCTIALYKKELKFTKDIFQKSLSFYPEIIEIFEENRQVLFLEECLKFFLELERISNIDKQGVEYFEQIGKIKEQINKILIRNDDIGNFKLFNKKVV